MPCSVAPPRPPAPPISQEKRCRDPIFALLLYGNVIAIAVVVGVYGTSAFSELLDDATTAADASSSYDYSGYVRATFVLGAAAIVLTGLTLPVMLCIPGVLIKCSLLAMLVMSMCPRHRALPLWEE